MAVRARKPDWFPGIVRMRHDGDAFHDVQWWNHSGKRRTKCTHATDKATAERIAAKLESDAALRRERVIDATQERIDQEAQRPISDHLRDYKAKLQTAKRGRQHVNTTIRYIQRIAEFAGFRMAADITAEAVNHYAVDFTDQDLSARTVQAHLGAIKGFTKWLAERQKLNRDPLVSVRAPNPKKRTANENGGCCCRMSGDGCPW